MVNNSACTEYCQILSQNKKGVISWRAKVSGNWSYKRLPFITERSRAAILRTSSAQNTLIVNSFLNLIFKLLLFRSAWNHFKTECWILCIWAKSRQKHMIDFHLDFWQTPPFSPLFLVLRIKLWCADYDQHLRTFNTTYIFTSYSGDTLYTSFIKKNNSPQKCDQLLFYFLPCNKIAFLGQF